MTVHKLQVMSHPTWQIARRPWTESPRANLAAHETKWNVPLKESPGIDIATGAVKYTEIKHRILFPTLNAKTILLLRYKNEICKLFSWTDKKPWFIIVFLWVFINLRIPRVAAIKFQKDSNMQIRLFVECLHANARENDETSSNDERTIWLNDERMVVKWQNVKIQSNLRKWQIVKIQSN